MTDKTNVLDYRQKMRNLKVDDVVCLQANGCHFHHSEVAAGNVLFIPTGWLVAQMSVGSDYASGLKRSVLVQSTVALEAAEVQLAALAKCECSPGIRTSFQCALDIIAVEKAKL